MIDLCPVGALTCKPFRYSARTWELARRKSVSPHDGLGSNLRGADQERPGDARAAARERSDQRMLAVRPGPLSYEALNSDERLTQPDAQARRAVAGGGLADGAGLRRQRPEGRRGAARRRRARRARHAASHAGGALPAAASSLRGLGSDNVDFRLRQSDFSPTASGGVPWLGMPVADAGRARPGAGGRLVPAQGSSAHRAPPAPGGQAGRSQIITSDDDC